MNILLAEDDGPTRLLLESTIRRCGHESTSVADGESAWAAFERERPPMVMLDWQMPGLDGIEVCRRIRGAGGAETFVLMVTGRDAAGDLDRALDAGVDDYVLKPVTREQLRARLTIAERRIADAAARRRVEEQLARAQWLAGIGETTLAVQHELNNPLLALMVGVQLFAEEAGLTEDQRQQSRAILEQARRIADVVKRLAALQSPQSVEYIPGSRMLDLSGKRTT